MFFVVSHSNNNFQSNFINLVLIIIFIPKNLDETAALLREASIFSFILRATYHQK